MVDLISRAAAIKGLLSMCPEKTEPGSFDEYGVTVLCGAVDVVIKALPAVDAAPVVMAGAELTDAELIEAIRKAPITLKPAVDAAPVVHGRWVNIPDKPEWDQKMCSVCGDYFCCQGNYCPNCGAKMDGERRDDKCQG